MDLEVPVKGQETKHVVVLIPFNLPGRVYERFLGGWYVMTVLMFHNLLLLPK